MRTYALREPSTGYYMPARRGRGFTNDEPVKSGGYWGPRFFKSEHAAKCALRAWERGVWIRKRTGYMEDYGEEIKIKPKDHRIGRVAVVCFSLHELKKLPYDPCE